MKFSSAVLPTVKDKFPGGFKVQKGTFVEQREQKRKF